MRKADGDKYKDLAPYKDNHEERKQEHHNDTDHFFEIA
jgi:hypothetical protein